MNYHGIIDTPCGPLGYVIQDGALTCIDFMPDGTGAAPAHDALGRRIESRLQRFFAKACKLSDLPLHPTGTPFQRRVWRALQGIAPGDTVSYGQIARQLGSGARAVGGACRANPIPIVIPCHRVVAASGMGGYCGASNDRLLRVKRWLLSHERA